MGYIYNIQTPRNYLNFSLSNFSFPEEMTSNKIDFLEEDTHSTAEKKSSKYFCMICTFIILLLIIPQKC